MIYNLTMSSQVFNKTNRQHETIECQNATQISPSNFQQTEQA